MEANNNIQIEPKGFLQPSTKQKLTLAGCEKTQKEVKNMIGLSFMAQKTYGKSPEELAGIKAIMLKILAPYDPEKVMKAFVTHMKRSDELPTPANIVSLIKRNGRAPLRESDIIAIRKKDGVDRTSDDWQMLREWEEEQQEGWSNDDAHKQMNLQHENHKLREENEQLRKQLSSRQLAQHCEKKLEEVVLNIKKSPEITPQQRIDNTINMMRKNGATEKAILEFIESMR